MQPDERYFDYAAATPVRAEVLAAMQPFYETLFYNPSALYAGSREVKKLLEEARSQVASTLGVRSSEVVFCAGGSESTNLAIKGIMQQHPAGTMLVSAIEHEAVLKPSAHFPTRLLPVDGLGRVELAKVESLIDDSTVLLSVMLVNNEVGTIQPLAELSQIVKNVRRSREGRGCSTPLYLHSDAAQAPLYLDVQPKKLGVDLLSLNGGKMHGPKQSGILYVRAGIQLAPQIEGGGQEFGWRQGTENVAFAVDFATALSIAQTERKNRTKTISRLRDQLMVQLQDRFGAEINGHRHHRVANNVHATFDGVDNERVLFALDEAGFAVAAGSACSASNEAPSHVLAAMGLSEKEARSSLRFSLGEGTSESGIDQLLQALQNALKS